MTWRPHYLSWIGPLLSTSSRWGSLMTYSLQCPAPSAGRPDPSNSAPNHTKRYLACNRGLQSETSETHQALLTPTLSKASITYQNPQTIKRTACLSLQPLLPFLRFLSFSGDQDLYLGVWDPEECLRWCRLPHFQANKFAFKPSSIASAAGQPGRCKLLKPNWLSTTLCTETLIMTKLSGTHDTSNKIIMNLTTLSPAMQQSINDASQYVTPPHLISPCGLSLARPLLAIRVFDGHHSSTVYRLLEIILEDTPTR